MLKLLFFLSLFICSTNSLQQISTPPTNKIVEKWKNCFPGSDRHLKKIKILIISDYGIYEKFNFSEEKFNANFLNITQPVIDIYEKQIGVRIIFKSRILRSLNDLPTINRKKGTANYCYDDPGEILRNFEKTEIYKTQDDSYGILMIQTTCSFGGYAGTATIARACQSISNVGWFRSINDPSVNLAHEIGHLFGADHSFEQAGRGGIMDYYKHGIYNGIFQFRIDFRRYEICHYLNKLVNRNVYDPKNLDQCFPWVENDISQNKIEKIQFTSYFNDISLPTLWECDGIFDSPHGDDEYVDGCNENIRRLPYIKCPIGSIETIEGPHVKCLFKLSNPSKLDSFSCQQIKLNHMLSILISSTKFHSYSDWLDNLLLGIDEKKIHIYKNSIYINVNDYKDLRGFKIVCEMINNKIFWFTYQHGKINGECTVNRCLNEGKCISKTLNEHNYKCFCKDKFTGTRCEEFIFTNCRNDPNTCKNGGTCPTSINNGCTCSNGFIGSTCNMCQPGEDINNNCNPCRSGTYSDGTVPCQLCPIHTYSPSVNSTKCIFCPGVNIIGSTSCENKICDKGRGLPNCELCGAGTYSDGTTNCISCPKHTISKEGSYKCYFSYKSHGTYRFVIRECDAGQDILNNCEECLPGYFSVRNSQCLPCPTNTYSQNKGSDSCTLCLGAGEASTSCSWNLCRMGQDINNNCHRCPAGTYSNGEHECKICPKHTYSLEGSFKCYFCYGARERSSSCNI